MRPEAVREARDWLVRAERDLRVARGNLAGPEVFADVAAFSSQQAAEKALKAFLTAHDHPFPKTHDLERLVGWCEHLGAEFAHFADAARVLSPYVVEFRYPGGPLEPAVEDAEQAIQLAGEIVEFVRQRLFPGGTP
ncbi:MAG: HEPN domain-containing protein [Chloroflexi bacterium]|nr:HEPN domain-containing protein [Chloroflexota bacterium]